MDGTQCGVVKQFVAAAVFDAGLDDVAAAVEFDEDFDGEVFRDVRWQTPEFFHAGAQGIDAKVFECGNGFGAFFAFGVCLQFGL